MQCILSCERIFTCHMSYMHIMHTNYKLLSYTVISVRYFRADIRVILNYKKQHGFQLSTITTIFSIPVIAFNVFE